MPLEGLEAIRRKNMTFREQAEQLVSKMTLEEKMSQMKYNAPAIERLGIPAYNWWNECLHGVARAGVATVFPQAIGMAASFDPEMLNRVATAISDEARAKYNEYKKFGSTEIYQGLTFWSPNINIFRDPRWGRGHETYGEDPYLTALMGTAFVKGLQGEGKYRKLDATLKHFAVHSGPESMRHGFNARVSEKDMRETYLWAFRYVIKHADPSAVMGAYNRVNGEPCCASHTLLQKYLFGEFGFDGYVVSDCGAIADINENHHVTANAAESSALAVNNGCQLNCGKAYESLKEAVEQGLLTEETITAAVVRLFTARFRLGMFADDCEYDRIPYSVVECSEHRELNRRMAQESMVLLKNDGVLPLKNGCSVAVIGPNADDESVLLGNYNGTPSEYVTLLEGIREASSGKVTYARGCHISEKSIHPWAEHPTREAIIAAKKSDVVILCMGLNPSMEGEEGDAYNGALSGDKRDLELPAPQKELYNEIMKLGKPVVFVNVSGSCVGLADQDKRCNAVLQCFYPGAEGGHALADILFGAVSPSGRLPVTFYASADDLPLFDDYSMENRTYKFFKGTPVYPFGHGLTYAKISEKWLDGDTVELINDSDVSTQYTVLKFASVPHRELRGFRRVSLNAHEKLKVSFE
jgi:beta-glucosidase